MNNKKSKKILSLLIAAVFCVTTFAVSGVAVEKVYAEEENLDLPTSIDVLYYPKDKANCWEYLADSGLVEIDMESVQSTDLEVAWMEYDSKYQEYDVWTSKPGTATLTFQAKAPESSVWVDATLIVNSNKYVRPCKTFKIGKKNYTKKFTNKAYFSSKKKVSGKLVIKPAKGWKIKEIQKVNFKTYKSKKVKNKSKITMKKNDYLFVSFKKNGVWEYLGFYIP